MKDFESQTNMLTESVIGAAIEVHRHLGPGFLESTYARALAIELGIQGIAFQQEVPATLTYKTHAVGEGRIDMVIDQQLVLELKAVKDNAKAFRRQVMAYLKSINLPLGLVINFNQSKLMDGVVRVANTRAPT